MSCVTHELWGVFSFSRGYFLVLFQQCVRCVRAEAAESTDNLSAHVVQKYLDDEPLSFFKVSFSACVSAEAVFLTSVCRRGSFYCTILIQDGKKTLLSVSVAF